MKFVCAISEEWKTAWETEPVVNSHLVLDPTVKVPGFKLKKKAWKNLNRIRTNCCRCNYSLHKWNIIDSPNCVCGAREQTIAHIICVCPDNFFSGDLIEFHRATSESPIKYLEELAIEL